MLSKLNKIKNAKGFYLIAAGLILGILLIIISGGSDEKPAEIQMEVTDPKTEASDYIKDLEFRVKTLLEAMDGISSVNVIITPDSTSETVYAENGRYSGGSLTEKEYVITNSDNGNSPVTIKLLFPKLRGIAVVCHGGSNPINQQKIVGVLCALFDLSASHVYVSG